jgi:hypothetical protein
MLNCLQTETAKEGGEEEKKASRTLQQQVWRDQQEKKHPQNPASKL